MRTFDNSLNGFVIDQSGVHAVDDYSSKLSRPKSIWRIK